MTNSRQAISLESFGRQPQAYAPFLCWAMSFDQRLLQWCQVDSGHSSRTDRPIILPGTGARGESVATPHRPFARK